MMMRRTISNIQKPLRPILALIVLTNLVGCGGIFTDKSFLSSSDDILHPLLVAAKQHTSESSAAGTGPFSSLGNASYVELDNPPSVNPSVVLADLSNPSNINVHYAQAATSNYARMDLFFDPGDPTRLSRYQRIRVTANIAAGKTSSGSCGVGIVAPATDYGLMRLWNAGTGVFFGNISTVDYLPQTLILDTGTNVDPSQALMTLSGTPSGQLIVVSFETSTIGAAGFCTLINLKTVSMTIDPRP